MANSRMLVSQTFHVIFISENHGVGITASDTPNKLVAIPKKQLIVTP
jgi:hypothetical protein